MNIIRRIIDLFLIAVSLTAGLMFVVLALVVVSFCGLVGWALGNSLADAWWGGVIGAWVFGIGGAATLYARVSED